MTATPSPYSPSAMAPAVATVIRKHSSNTFPFRMPRNALRRMSYPTVRYGIRNSPNSAHRGMPVFRMPSEIRNSGTQKAAATTMRTSSFFCFVFIAARSTFKGDTGRPAADRPRAYK